MSEEKIIKHSTEAVHALLKKGSWKKKVQEFFFEIIIIIIAVSITLWFHNWNDHLRERRMARDFLVGTRSDLKFTVEKLESYYLYRHKNPYWPGFQFTDLRVRERSRHTFPDHVAGRVAE